MSGENEKTEAQEKQPILPPRIRFSHGEKGLTELLTRNREWAAKLTAENPDFFEKLSKQQNPKILWIGIRILITSIFILQSHNFTGFFIYRML